MRKSDITAYTAIIFAMLFWSYTFIWYKIAYEYYEPVTVIFFRLIISSVLLFIIISAIGKLQRPVVEDLKYFLLVAIFNPFLYFLGESYGVKFVSSSISAVIIATIPLVTSFVSSFFFKENITKINIVGIIFSIIGVGIILFEKGSGLSVSAFGVGMLFLAVASAVAYSMVIKKLSFKYNSATIVTYHNFIGIFLFAPLFFIIDFPEFKEHGLIADAWLPLMELAVFGSSLAFIFFTYGIQKIGITKANAFANAIPVFTAIISYFVLDEYFNVSKIAGICIVISGLFLSQIKFKTPD